MRNHTGIKVLVSSYICSELAAIRGANESTAGVPLFERACGNVLENAGELESRCINTSEHMTKTLTIESCHEAGVTILFYSVNQILETQRLKAMAVAVVFTPRLEFDGVHQKADGVPRKRSNLVQSSQDLSTKLNRCDTTAFFRKGLSD